MSDGQDVPVVRLPGSLGWVTACERGREWADAFPGQDAYDLASAIAENGWGPLADHELAGLLMVQEGERDGAVWIWLVALDDGSHWWAVGWCDYTGWDCQSELYWTRVVEGE